MFKSIVDMTLHELLERTKLLETKINDNHKTDWLLTQAYVADLKRCDDLMLSRYDLNTIIKEYECLKQSPS